ncbi:MULTISPECIES: DUF2586 family protein [Bizionia]|uniref:DUF2586 family protein n=1 Tax=Bizionia algoritergicola TaxID=291187 RepID=A0A5D0QZE7_9FLAO|nr:MULTISPECIES: DUF2586 family protein [Bizionia]OBX20962.1 hypothetical protein BAA08_14585 [Bizionia sp. APA-3]TYB74587.1 DUF2586 family protein [Bizionia algoritergicola]
MLPGINIKFSNGNIGTVVPTVDGVFGLLASAVAVVDKFALNTPYILRGMTDVAKLGILPDVNNGVLYQWLSDYYAEAGEGQEVWLMGFPKTDKVSDWFTPDVGTGKTPAQSLLDASNGRLSGLFTCFSPDGAYTLTLANGIDEDVVLAKSKAQTLGENYTTNEYTPFFTVLEGYGYSGTASDLADLKEESNNRVGVLIGSTKKRTDVVTNNGASTGVVAGRLAAIQVHESAGKVRTGALKTLTAYIVDEPAESADIETLHNKGYMTFRQHKRKAGYYIVSGILATSEADDYQKLARRRVIDKAYRIAHNIVSEEIENDFDLTNEGTIDPIYAKDVEGNLENAIARQMTDRGELSKDKANPNDDGVKAAFNLTNNVSQTNRIEMTLKVRPKGYAEFIEILLGYDVNLNE